MSFELCSDECREKAVQESKVQRSQNSDNAEIDSLLAATRSHWTRRLAKIKKSPEWSAENVQKFEEAIRTFRKEATSLRTKHKHGELPTSEFTNWLFMQQRKAESVLQELMVTKR